MPYSSLYLSEFPYHLAANLSGVDDTVLILIKYKRLIREQDREVNFFFSYFMWQWYENKGFATVSFALSWL